MASITSIPAELIDQITSECQGLNQDDILAVRMSCKTLSVNFREAHLNAIFGTRRVFLCPASLENLVKISRHPSGANLRVRRIIISRTVPYATSLRAQYRPDSLQNSEVIADKIIETSKAHVSEVTQMFQFKQYPVLLAVAFQNLPGIRTLSFASSGIRIYGLSRSEMNLIFPSLRCGPGILSAEEVRAMSQFIYDTCVEDFSFDEYTSLDGDIWSSVVYALANSGIKGVERIDNSGAVVSGLQQDHISVPPNYLRKLESVFFNLKALDIQMSLQPKADCYDFGEWIKAIGRNLEDLRVNNLSEKRHENPRWLVPISPEPVYSAIRLSAKILPKLKTLRLSGFKFYINEFSEFINSCDRLESFALTDSRFKNPSEDWFRFLRSLQRNNHALRNTLLTIALAELKGFPNKAVLYIHGHLDSENTICRILPNENLESIALTSGAVIEKNIKRELDTHHGAAEFWKAMGPS
ncbi:hypothetical protein TWF281_002906 [Arthrobotrys megalospora]